jgi:hypothetical protein
MLEFNPRFSKYIPEDLIENQLNRAAVTAHILYFALHHNSGHYYESVSLD